MHREGDIDCNAIPWARMACEDVGSHSLGELNCRWHQRQNIRIDCLTEPSQDCPAPQRAEQGVDNPRPLDISIHFLIINGQVLI